MARTLVFFHTGPPPENIDASLRDREWDVIFFHNLPQGTRLLKKKEQLTVGLLFIDRIIPNLSEELEEFLRINDHVEWVGVFTPLVAKVPGYIDLILHFLFDHHTLPVDPVYLMHSLGHAYGRSRLRGSTNKIPPINGASTVADKIVGTSAAMGAMMHQIKKIAVTNAPVLISGESGSGKELAAYAVHHLSRRSQHPFIAVNCGAISPMLIQAELFGVARGAFTGATQDRRGLIEAAHHGTLLLDEIGDLPLEMQTNLLRFLQEQMITPVGATNGIKVDVRVIAAGNTDLHKAVTDGTFRQDLLYRLNVIPIVVPPLRKRREDIADLARYYFHLHRSERAAQVRGFSSAAMRAMLEYDWPGNIRELINRVRRALVLTEGRLIAPGDLGLSDISSATSSALGEIRDATDRGTLFDTLIKTNGNVTRAADTLRVSRMTLYRMIDRHKIDLSATKKPRNS